MQSFEIFHLFPLKEQQLIMYYVCPYAYVIKTHDNLFVQVRSG